MSPDFTIVMPYRSRVRQLELTLESYRRFYPEPPEIVIVNDGLPGSFDAEIEWPKLTVIDSGRENGGNPAPLFNLGVRAASNDIVALTNPECTHSANLFENWHQDATNGRYVVFGCRNVLEIPESLDNLLSNPEAIIGGWYQHSILANRLFHEFALISKEIYWKVNGFSEEFVDYGYEDHDFIEKIMAAEIPVVTVDEPYCYHLYHERNPWEPTNEALYVAKWNNIGRIFG